MNGRRAAVFVAVAFILWWVIEDPAGAAHVVHNIAAFFQHAAHGLSAFFSDLSF